MNSTSSDSRSPSVIAKAAATKWLLNNPKRTPQPSSIRYRPCDDDIEFARRSAIERVSALRKNDDSRRYN